MAGATDKLGSWRLGPPPEAWEKSAAANVTQKDGTLELLVPDAGDGWPTFVRGYFWREGGLHCVVRIAGGTRPAQVIQIFQVPGVALVSGRAVPTAEAPHGYTLVHLGREPSPRFEFSPPPQVLQHGEALRIRFTGKSEKLGLSPQPLSVQLGDQSIRVSRGRETGSIDTVLDAGFMTQIYLGDAGAPLIELEQLSPSWAAQAEASFEVILEPGRVSPSGEPLNGRHQ